MCLFVPIYYLLFVLLVNVSYLDGKGNVEPQGTGEFDVKLRYEADVSSRTLMFCFFFFMSSTELLTL